MKKYKVWYHPRGYLWGRGGHQDSGRANIQNCIVEAGSGKEARDKISSPKIAVIKVRLIK